MKYMSTANVVGLALTLALISSPRAAAAPQGLGPPIIDYLEIQTLTRHQRVSVHGVNLEQSGEIHIGGISALVVPIPGTNAVKMNAYVPADTPFGFNDVTVTTSVGTSNPLSLEVVPRAPKGRELWRFFMNNQLMIHRPSVGSDGTIYARSQAGDLTAISPDGELKWQVFLGGDLTPTVSIGPDDTIYTADSTPTIYAVNPGDGSIKWTWTDPIPNQGVVAGPNVGPDGNIYAVTHVPGLGALSLDPLGNLRWSGPDQGIYSPIGQIGQEIVFSDTQLFFCVDYNFDSFSFDGDLLFATSTVTNHFGDSPQAAVGPNGDSYIEEWGQLRSHAPDGSLNWIELGVGGTYIRDPDVGPDGTIYAKRNVFNTLHALDPDGSEKWQYSHPETLLNPVMDPTGETIIIGAGGSGTAYFLAIDKNGTPQWQVDMPTEPLTPFETVLAFPQGRARFTPDGSVAYVMASSTSNSGGHSYLYAIQVAACVDVGHGMEGTAGMPRLQGTGTLEGGAPLSISLDGVQPGASVFLVIGQEAAATPFMDGVLLPSPEVVLPLVSDSAGKVQLNLTWPAGVPSETTTYWQVWCPDPGTSSGWAASNALSLITP